MDGGWRLILNAAQIPDHRKLQWPACTRNPATAVLFAPDCNLAQTVDSRCSMCHTSHVTCLMAKKKKKKACANPHRHAAPQSHVLNVLHLQSANRRREIWSSQYWQAHNPTLGCKSIRFDSVLFTAEETWNEKWTQWWILILVHLVFSSLHLTMPQTITLLHQCFTLITLFKPNCQEILVGFLSTIYKWSFFHFINSNF